jgi:hypothetical protein
MGWAALLYVAPFLVAAGVGWVAAGALVQCRALWVAALSGAASGCLSIGLWLLAIGLLAAPVGWVLATLLLYPATHPLAGSAVVALSAYAGILIHLGARPEPE